MGAAADEALLSPSLGRDRSQSIPDARKLREAIEGTDDRTRRIVKYLSSNRVVWGGGRCGRLHFHTVLVLIGILLYLTFLLVAVFCAELEPGEGGRLDRVTISLGGAWFGWVLAVSQALVAGWAVLTLLLPPLDQARYVHRYSLGQAASTFLTVLMCFAALYTIIAMGFPNAFNRRQHVDNRLAALDLRDRAFAEAIAMFYFATATQTLVGFGDIDATLPSTQVLAAVQQSFSVVFSVLIISQALELLAGQAEQETARSAADSPRKPRRLPAPASIQTSSSTTANAAVAGVAGAGQYAPPSLPPAAADGAELAGEEGGPSPRLQPAPAPATPLPAATLERHQRAPSAAGQAWSAMVHNPAVTSARRCTRAYLLLISAGIQAVVVATLMAVQATGTVDLEDESLQQQAALLLAGLLLLQVVQVIILTLAAFRLVSAKFQITVSLLLQSYLAAILAFAGIYFTIDLASPGHRRAFHVTSRAGQAPVLNATDITNSTQVWFLAADYGELAYFSTSLQTSAGLGDVYPLSSIARLLCCLHMLLSMFYSTVVLGYGLAHIGSSMRQRSSIRRALTARADRRLPAAGRQAQRAAEPS